MPTAKVVKDQAADVWRKATTPGGAWTKEDFPRLPAALFWLRLIIGLVLGVIAAVLDLRGQIGVVGYAVTSSVIVFLYYAKFLDVDVEDFGNGSLISEGFMPGLGLYILTWSILHNVLRVESATYA